MAEKVLSEYLRLLDEIDAIMKAKGLEDLDTTVFTLKNEVLLEGLAVDERQCPPLNTSEVNE